MKFTKTFSGDWQSEVLGDLKVVNSEVQKEDGVQSSDIESWQDHAVDSARKQASGSTCAHVNYY